MPIGTVYKLHMTRKSNGGRASPTPRVGGTPTSPSTSSGGGSGSRFPPRALSGLGLGSRGEGGTVDSTDSSGQASPRGSASKPQSPAWVRGEGDRPAPARRAAMPRPEMAGRAVSYDGPAGMVRPYVPPVRGEGEVRRARAGTKMVVGPEEEREEGYRPSYRVLILYHSTYGHIKKMADAVAAGINSVEGCEAILFQVPETLSEERLRKMNAPKRATDPTLEYEEMNGLLQNVAGLMLGIPTRFGMMPSQMKAWFDSTSKLWTKGHLVGKPAGCFFSSAVQGGGQETTALTTVTQLTHHGMVFVPPGYSFGARMFDNSEVHGGSPYGAGCIAGGDGTRQPSKFELDYARHQGVQFAGVAKKLARRD